MSDPNRAHNEDAAKRVKAAIPKYNVRSHLGEASNLLLGTVSTALSIGASNPTDLNSAAARRGIQLPADVPASRPLLPKLGAADDAAAADPHAAERKMFDDIIGGKPSRPHPPAAASAAASAAPSTGGSGDLVTVMAVRLRKLEEAQKQYRQQLIDKDREILELKRQLEGLQIASSPDQDAMVREMNQLRQDKDAAHNQIAEMKDFLRDYGLIWVGSSSSSEANTPASSGDPPSASSGASSDFAFNFSILEERLKYLNALAGEGKTEVKRVNGVARLGDKSEAVPLRIYRDGILVRRGPFRSFAQESARSFVNDILDGYFPVEFKDSHPDGVVFDYKLHPDKQYQDNTSFEAFSGKGMAVGDAPKVRGLADIGGAEFALGQKEFLERLPASVIREGKVVPIRAGIAEMLQPVAVAEASAKPNIINVETPAALGTLPEETKIATLQVKSDSGDQTLVIKLAYDDTIGTVKYWINKHRMNTAPYDLRTAMPRMAYTDDTQTLRSCGLIPNATLLIHTLE